MATYTLDNINFEVEVITHIVENGNSYVVIHSEDMLNYLKGGMACIIHTPDADGDLWIICGDDFMELPFLLRKRIVWHEIGHHECQPEYRFVDYDDYCEQRISLIYEDRVLPEELEADEYSLEAFDTDELKELAKQLVWFSEYAFRNFSTSTSWEYDMRIKHMLEVISGIVHNNPAYLVA